MISGRLSCGEYKRGPQAYRRIRVRVVETGVKPRSATSGGGGVLFAHGGVEVLVFGLTDQQETEEREER
jgi:hypothetical protein